MVLLYLFERWAFHVAEACLELSLPTTASWMMVLLVCATILGDLAVCCTLWHRLLIPSASQLVNVWSPGLSSGFTDFSLFIVSTYSSGNSICLQIPQHVADAKLLYWHYLGKPRAFSRLSFGLTKHSLKSKILYGSIHFNILLCKKNENPLTLVIIKFTFSGGGLSLPHLSLDCISLLLATDWPLWFLFQLDQG